MASYEYDSQNQELKRIAGGTLYADCPIGSYIPFGGTAIPTGWLLCNGQAVSRTDYADLFAVIGTAYGSGDGSTTFNIPDLREAVPKGAGLTSKSNNHMDADGLAVGEFLDDRLQDHKHKIYYQGVAIGSGFYAYSVDSQSQTGSTREVQTDTRTGATTEVKSVGSNYIIKAKQIGVPADFAPVDTVASGNMHSVTSGAVYSKINELLYQGYYNANTDRTNIENRKQAILHVIKNIPSSMFTIRYADGYFIFYIANPFFTSERTVLEIDSYSGATNIYQINSLDTTISLIRSI